MSGSDGIDYFAWVKTGHFNLIFGIVGLVLFGLTLIVAISEGATISVIIFAVLTLVSVANIVRGAQRLQVYRGRQDTVE